MTQRKLNQGNEEEIKRQSAKQAKNAKGVIPRKACRDKQIATGEASPGPVNSDSSLILSSECKVPECSRLDHVHLNRDLDKEKAKG